MGMVLIVMALVIGLPSLFAAALGMHKAMQLRQGDAAPVEVQQQLQPQGLPL